MNATLSGKTVGISRLTDDKDGLYVALARGGSLEYAALVYAVGFAAKAKLGGHISINYYGLDGWLLTTQGLKNYHIVRQQLMRGEEPKAQFTPAGY